MEKYSKHLESIVTERTQDLVAEKQKTDRLLYSESVIQASSSCYPISYTAADTI